MASLGVAIIDFVILFTCRLKWLLFLYCISSDNTHARFFLCTSLLLRKTVDFETYIAEACERYRFRRRTLRDDLSADGGVVIEVFARR